MTEARLTDDKYTAAEVANMLHVTARCVTRWAANDKIPGAHKVNGVWLLDKRTVDLWYQKTARRPPQWRPSTGDQKANSGMDAYNAAVRTSGSPLRQLLGL